MTWPEVVPAEESNLGRPMRDRSFGVVEAQYRSAVEGVLAARRSNHIAGGWRSTVVVVEVGSIPRSGSKADLVVEVQEVVPSRLCQ